MDRLKKIGKYTSNILLILIVLTLFIPSWRLGFQTFINKLFMSDLVFETTNGTPIESDFALFTENDEVENFQSLKGKPIVMSAWRTWCAPCRAELPELLELKEHFGDKIHVIAATNEDFEIINKAGIDLNEFSFIRHAPYLPDEIVVKAFPTLFLITPNLELVSTHEGGGNIMNEENMNLLNAMIQQ